MSRHYWAFGSDDISDNPELILFAHNGYLLSPATLTHIAAHLRACRNVIVFRPAKERPAGQPDMLTQLETRLGTASLHREQSGTYHSWPGCGYVLMLSDGDTFTNDHYPAFEARPDGKQQEKVNAIMDLIRDAIRDHAARAR